MPTLQEGSIVQYAGDFTPLHTGPQAAALAATGFLADYYCVSVRINVRVRLK